MRDGVVLLGHIQSIQGYQVALAPDMKENLSKADKFEVDFVKQIDEYSARNGVEAPIENLPQLRDGYDTNENSCFGFQNAGITSVIWATGYNLTSAW